MQTQVEFTVPARVFVPQPKVDSAIVSLTPRKIGQFILQTTATSSKRCTDALCTGERTCGITCRIVRKAPETKEKIQSVLDELEIDPQFGQNG
ncbi:hypothetical protein BIY40_06770 [Pediococcus acidilactici]|nr:hypothetical protein BIY40_06770 [Pediococcus acidilactici]